MEESEQFVKAVDQFNNADFFTAHDSFEELWSDCRTDGRDFLQGLVQLSVGMFHLISGNFKGAVSQLSKSVEKLERFTPKFSEIDVFYVVSKVKNLIFEIEDFQKNDESKSLKELITYFIFPIKYQKENHYGDKDN
ncbi:MAG: hypothetical protein COW85_04900 [Ignavibacteria bacterium CG22_combo_CG10-13_8_21_14_all_37_15]|nr:DUF309 domain-containing protein [Ignavibacteria bacterium]OIO20352.1 MAG: hypothetical protein AUJ54_05710 [Ignavibacteria bacterium CG1_02_37_35]PIP78238.1 MAG: hypothetical protein COW85_04900 [Ignavibacteria bacterium CG22_combo_CG10-13_8_21_14_all_37_15]PIS44947.1 MAG: hypothetical protein COT22_07800 [Ignavibacteria bacterium CG08_land_8_20_14_0_20_37_9]PIX94816.1 MAG: hypothetical protein COZ25_03595 [Ignavibacteria bacterium CG_4_10_14_3_um_filter_37_18]PJC60989.1 MAG: hypothetical 